MKQQFTVIALIFSLLLTMAGCSAAGMEEKLDIAENKVEEKLDAVEDSVEQSVRRAVTPAPAATPTFPAPAPIETAATTITQAQAENIALEFAGFSAAQVTRLRTEYEIDDGIPQYNVEFHEGDWEYEFEISATDGKILSYDKDHKFD